MSRVAVLVSGGGTNLQALINAKLAGEMPHARLVLVVSSKSGAGALQRARQGGIPARVVERRAYPNPCDYDSVLLDVLQQHHVDVVVLAGFLSILGPAVLRAYPDRIINVHPSLIPSFCGEGCYGLKVHKAALARGVTVSGATVHLVNEVVDGGKILLQQPVPVLPDDTPETLQHRVMEEAEWLLLPRAVEMICHTLETTKGKNEMTAGFSRPEI